MNDIPLAGSRHGAGLPFGLWWAVAEAVAAITVLPVLRLLGAL